MSAKTIDALLEQPMRLLGGILRLTDSVALLDYPEYANVGDSMIWLGQIELLRRLGKKIVYASTLSNFDEDEVAAVVARGAALIINGGGNFGTLWPHHQAFRERVMTRFPDALIVQMPQSICFEETADSGAEPALARARRVIARCGNLHLLVRDQPSLEFAQRYFDARIFLCPDSAFFLRGLRAAPADRDIVYLHRTDKEGSEKSADSASLPPLAAASSLFVTDWLRQSWSETQLQRVLRWGVRTGVLRNSQPLTIALYNALARLRVRRGARLLASGRCVITDRLHAHVLSILLDRPNYVLDNANGKVLAFYEAWTRDLGGSRPARSLDEALRMAGALPQ